ncbi:DUF7660 family protein [Hymenobacter fodinae]
MEQLDELLENINSKTDFLRFVQALSDDRLDEVSKNKVTQSSPYSLGANGWENDSIASFLDAISRYGQDSQSISGAPSWKDFALLLYAGKFYE